MNKLIYTVGILIICFIILSPGIGTNPCSYSNNKYRYRNFLFSGNISIITILIHSIIFGGLAYLILDKYTLAVFIEEVIPLAESELVPLVNTAVTSTSLVELVPLVNNIVNTAVTTTSLI